MSQKKIIPVLPESTNPNLDGYLVYDDGVLTYKISLNTVLEIVKENTVNEFSTILSFSGVTLNISGGSTNHNISLTGTTTTLNLINVRNGDHGTIILTQGSGGNKTILLGTINGSSATHKVVNSGNGIVSLSTNQDDVDVISFIYDGSNVYWTVNLNYT